MPPDAPSPPIPSLPPSLHPKPKTHQGLAIQSTAAAPQPEPNRAAILLIRVNASVDSLHTHVTKELMRLREHLDEEFKKLHGCMDRLETTLTQLRSLKVFNC